MFKREQFTHIAASNRDNIKFGVFVYKTTDPIEAIMASGYFNDKLIDLQEHDIILVVREYTEIEQGVLVNKAKLEQLYVSEKTLDNIKTAYAVTSGGGEGGAVDDVKVNGTSVVVGGVAVIDLTPYVQLTDLAPVATSNSYTDLDDLPTIPTVNNPTITFTQGGVSKGTITLNQSNDATIALAAGGGTAQVLADLGDVSVSGATDGQALTYDATNQLWKNSTISGGASALTDLTDVSITSVANGQLLSYDSSTQKWKNINPQSYSQVQADWNQTDSSAVDYIKNKPTVPTKTSDLTNDSGFITSSTVNSAITTHNSSDSAHSTLFAAKANDDTVVHKTGTETVTGNKTFTGSVSLGSSATATTQATGSNTTAVATTAFVKALIQQVSSLPANPDSNVWYAIPE